VAHATLDDRRRDLGLYQGAQAFGCAAGDWVAVSDGDNFGLQIRHLTYGGSLPRRIEVEVWPACLEHWICDDSVACKEGVPAVFKALRRLRGRLVPENRSF
jgi:hypothetical protein